MLKKLTIAAAVAAVASGGMVAAPATAQDYYGRDGYEQDYRGYDDDRYDQDARYEDNRQRREYRRYQRERRAQFDRQVQYDRYNRDGGYRNYPQHQGRYDRGWRGYDRRDGYAERRSYYQGQRCRSGTTGTVLGALAGGLLGREIGRGGRFDRPSTTGLILGAGGGALAGRALERSGNACR